MIEQNMNINPVFTIGHSTRSLVGFTNLLQQAGVDILVDVRRFPRSPRQPWFNIDVLPNNLARVGIRYLHLEALGGKRSAQEARPDGGPPRNMMWTHTAFQNYADYAETKNFRTAFDRLLLCAKNGTPAIMCAEANWEHCHRRIIADHLLATGLNVHHIMNDKIESARLTDGAAIEQGRLIYHPMGGLPLFQNLPA
jgi:uncharacterized protein (DUF488 family)